MSMPMARPAAGMARASAVSRSASGPSITGSQTARYAPSRSSTLGT